MGARAALGRGQTRICRLLHGRGPCDKLNVGAAVAADRGEPWGEYRDLGRPLVVDTNSMAGALDPHYFLDPVTR